MKTLVVLFVALALISLAHGDVWTTGRIPNSRRKMLVMPKSPTDLSACLSKDVPEKAQKHIPALATHLAGKTFSRASAIFEIENAFDLIPETAGWAEGMRAHRTLTAIRGVRRCGVQK